MKKILRLYINISIFVGLTLIVSPIAYLLYTATNDGTVSAFDPYFEREALLGEIEEDKQAIVSRDSEVTKALNALKAENTGKLAPSYFDTKTPADAVITHGFRLQIPSIGIDTFIYESYNSEEALKRGVWRKPDYGAPDRTEQPTVLAAHRWGYDTDSWEHRAKNLFLNLPNVSEGDEIIITWNAKTYTYVVKKKEVNTYVTELSDLILFTCEDYVSPERVFVYAELAE